MYGRKEKNIFIQKQKTNDNNRCKADTHFRLSAQFGVQPRKTTGRQPLVQVAFQTGERTVFQGEHGTEPLVRF